MTPPVPRVGGDPRNAVLPPGQVSPGARGFGGVATMVPGTNQRYTLNLGAATAGNLTLNPSGLGATGAIPFNATAAAVDTALEAVGGAGNFLVTGGPLPGTVTIEFTGALGESARTLTGDFTGLTGATPTLTSTQTGSGDVTGANQAASPQRPGRRGSGLPGGRVGRYPRG